MKLEKVFPLRMKLFPIISILIVLGLSITPSTARANEDDPILPGPVPLITEIEVNVDGERLEEIVIPVLFYNEEEKGMILGASGNSDEVIVGALESEGTFFYIRAYSGCDPSSIISSSQSQDNGVMLICLKIDPLTALKEGIYETKVDITDNDTSSDAVKLVIKKVKEDTQETKVIEKEIEKSAASFENLQIAIPLSISAEKYSKFIEGIKAVEGDEKEKFVGVVKFVNPVEEDEAQEPEEIEEQPEKLGYVYAVECTAETKEVALLEYSADDVDVFACVKVKGLDIQGDYKGTIDLFEDKENSFDNDVTLELFLEDSVRPLISEINIIAKRNPFNKEMIKDLQEIEIEYIVNERASAPDFYPEKFVLAGIDGKEEDAEVFMVNCPDNDHDKNLACVSVTGIRTTGDYDDVTIDPTNNGSTDDQVIMKIQVTDQFGWALLAIMIGVLIALVVAFMTQSGLPYMDLMAKYKKTKDEIVFVNENICAMEQTKKIKLFMRGEEWPEKGKIQIKWGGEKGKTIVDFEAQKKWWITKEVEVPSGNGYKQGDVSIYPIEARVLENEECKHILKKVYFMLPCPMSFEAWRSGLLKSGGEEKAEPDSSIWKTLWAVRGVFTEKKTDEQKKLSEKKEEDKPHFIVGIERGTFRLDIKDHFKIFIEEIEKYLKHLIWDTSSEEYTGLEKNIEDARGDLNLFKGEFTRTLNDLFDQKKEFEDFIKLNPLDVKNAIPKNLLNMVEKQMKGVDIPIGKVQKRIEAWKKIILLLQSWEKMGRQVKRYK
ncbi:MAG: hypothetical protein PVF83_19240, partial [Anaerolineales bacterium]